MFVYLLYNCVIVVKDVAAVSFFTIFGGISFFTSTVRQRHMCVCSSFYLEISTVGLEIEKKVVRTSVGALHYDFEKSVTQIKNSITHN